MTNRTSRQSFLGPLAEKTFPNARVGVFGLGGGGSHVVQQLAHVGFGDLVLCDPDCVEDSNLNRLVGACSDDAKHAARKIDVAERLIKWPNARARVRAHFGRWEEIAESLRTLDLIFGCLDGFSARRDLEAFARRYMIPLVDIGLDVHVAESGVPQMSGQVILSMPGALCMQCMGFLNPTALAREAAAYGAAGVRPQVVWANGVLASTAVALAVDLMTNWTGGVHAPIYLEYDGNTNELKRPSRAEYWPRECIHYPASEVGEPRFKPV